MVISVSLQGPPISSALTFFRESQKRKERALESSLLKSIRSALRGSGADVDSVHSSTALLGDDSSKTAELSWDAHTVVLSEGGVLKKKWNFEEECQSIQWACLGWLEQAKTVNSTATSSPHGHSRYSSDPDEFPLPFAADSAPKATFGPFARVGEHERRVAENAESPVRTVFVFLRSIGKMFLWNGLEYTFGLPFIVRRAWALHPHGVMIQRVLEPYEIEEAKVTGDIALPTLFSLTSPYAEPGAVGVTTGILRGVGKMPASLEDEDENSTRPLKSVPPTELVVSVTSRGFDSQTEDIVATIDVEKRHLTIWRYAYIRPKDIPVPLDSHRTRNICPEKGHP
jgi:anaphase-promoting complex subunit 1